MRAEHDVPDEQQLLAGTLRLLAVLALALTLAGLAFGGWTTAVSALIGAAFVVVLFGVSALLLATAARRGAGAALGVLVAGAAGRLGLYALALAGLAQVPWIDRPALGLSTATAIAVTLAYELRLLRRLPRLFWVDASAGRSPASDTTGSQQL